ncbi:MAG: hypothetical protein JKY13_03640 [Gammaproteobacteria bacterium]|nr:hypothetical protein [Gammaproteobacteria bacterium]
MDDNANQLIQIPEVSLPTGGGAVKGMGESFETNSFTGGFNVTLPIFASPCRGFEPSLALSYNTGAGNGCFGLGLELNVANISRRTDKGIPRYDDTDIFVLANGGELVLTEVLAHQRIDDLDDCHVTLYQPRTEGLFAKIQYVRPPLGDGYWVVVTTSNVISVYGRTSQARIVDPTTPTHIFTWLLEETYDDLGHRITYHYSADNDDNLLEAEVKNHSQAVNTYLSSVKYGYSSDTGGDAPPPHFEIVFDYGEYDDTDFEATPTTWKKRGDPFSSFRSGFEIRTNRLCRNILMFHRFPDQFSGQRYLVNRLSLNYQPPSQFSPMSQVVSVVQIGMQKQTDGSYLSKAVSPVDFAYTLFAPQGSAYQPLTLQNGESLPGVMGEKHYQLVDLEGEGIAGILYNDKEATYYLSPKGGGKFGHPEQPYAIPLDAETQQTRLQLIDVDQDGMLELVTHNGQSYQGYYPSYNATHRSVWRSFKTYPTNYDDAAQVAVDLTGDGLPDLAIFDEVQTCYYPNLGKLGYDLPVKLKAANDFPLQTQNSSRELITFTNIFGDGLSHRVRIRNGRIECWPNLGYGQFGDKITLANAPYIEGGFDIRHLFLADIDGTGATDVIYFHADHFDVYLNQCGNGFSEPIRFPFPNALYAYDDTVQIHFADILGRGSACLVMTHNGPQPAHYCYDFCPDGKPYLLTTLNNNSGTMTQVDYTSSVDFYLADRAAGNPWVTKAPFPITVVSAVSDKDLITQASVTQRYAYHHGYYDGLDKAFRGFGRVDAKSSADYDASADPTLVVAPTLTKTWYHTGFMPQNGHLSDLYQDEYYQDDEQALYLVDSSLETAVRFDADSYLELNRCLAGQVLHTEIYGVDGSEQSDAPYSVSESSYAIRLIQAKGDNDYGIYYAYVRENLSYYYERDARDPKINHAFT